MSIFDWFKSEPACQHLYNKINQLENINKTLRKENQHAWDQLNSLSLFDGKAFEVVLSNEKRKNEIKDEEIEWLKIQNKNLTNMANITRPENYTRDSENHLLKSDLIKAQIVIEQLKTDIRKQREYKSCRVEALEIKIKSDVGIIQDIREKNETLRKEKQELETELKIYKEFFADISKELSNGEHK